MNRPMTPKRIIIHCSASTNSVPYPISRIREDHIQRGFKDVGYHYVIQPNGVIETGRSTDKPGAHCEGANHDSVGVCLVGLDKFSSLQFSALEKLIDELFFRFTSMPPFAIYFHHQFPSAQRQGKTCPNLEINRFLYWYHCKDDKVIEPYLSDKAGRGNG